MTVLSSPKSPNRDPEIAALRCEAHSSDGAPAPKHHVMALDVQYSKGNIPAPGCANLASFLPGISGRQ